jgi:hypothetical protein
VIRDSLMRLGSTATLVGEFEAARSYFASEYGIAPRMPIHLLGQKQRGGVHGSVNWTLGNSVFSARTFFQVGGVKPAQDNTASEELGLRIGHNSYFSFSGTQGRRHGYVNGNVLIPLASEHTPLTQNPALAAIVQKYLDAYPAAAPNRTDMAPNAYNTNGFQTSDGDGYTGHLDQSIGPRDRVLARFGWNQRTTKAFQLVKGQNPNTLLKSQNAGLTWQHQGPGATTVNMSATFNHLRTAITPDAEAVGPTSIGMGYTQLGPLPNIPLLRSVSTFHYAATLIHAGNRHTTSVGLDTVRTRYNSDEEEYGRGSVNFSSDFGRSPIENLRWGTPSWIAVAISNDYRAFRNWQWYLHAGDKWRVTDSLTLNAVLRYEPWTTPVDITGRSHLAYGADVNNVGGNLGLAYRLPASLGTLRSAWGLMYGEVYPGTYGQDRYNAPNHVAMILPGASLLNPLAGVDTSNIAAIRANRVEVSADLATPYTNVYNLIWEAPIIGGWRVQAGYVGNHSAKLVQRTLTNRGQYVAGVAFTSGTLNQRRADTAILDHFLISNRARASYNAARVDIKTPLWRRSQLTASYWRSKMMDDGGDLTTTGISGGVYYAQTEYAVHTDQRALTTFDQPNALQVQAAYSVPEFRPGSKLVSGALRGWTITATGAWKTGTPFTVYTGADAPPFGNGDGATGDRPMVLNPALLGRTIGNPDTSKTSLPSSGFRFIKAPTEMAGNLGRNTFRRGPIGNVNASLARKFQVTNGIGLEFRWDVINLTNTAQFAEPGFYLATANFGMISNTLNDGRTMKFALGLQF